MKNKLRNIPASAPLLCWDIFMEGYHRKIQAAADLHRLRILSERSKWSFGWGFERQLMQLNKTVIVTDTSLQIAYASSNVLAMNGYEPSEIIGRRSAMFQGKDTSAQTRSMIREAVAARQPFVADILNYRKSGQRYMCHIEAFPLFNIQQKLVHFIAFENLV